MHGVRRTSRLNDNKKNCIIIGRTIHHIEVHDKVLSVGLLTHNTHIHTYYKLKILGGSDFIIFTLCLKLKN